VESLKWVADFAVGSLVRDDCMIKVKLGQWWWETQKKTSIPQSHAHKQHTLTLLAVL